MRDEDIGEQVTIDIDVEDLIVKAKDNNNARYNGNIENKFGGKGENEAGWLRNIVKYNYPCDQCNKIFRTKSYLQMLLRNCMDKNIVKSKNYFESFSLARDLTEQNRIHDDPQKVFTAKDNDQNFTYQIF